jgi:hypothetical protein
VASPEDAQWRRPTEPAATPPESPAAASTPWRSEYSGPPPNIPPPHDWRPEFVVHPSPPRPLPTQDHADLDAREQSARTLTYGFGLVAGALLLIVLCALCGRALF